MKQFPYDYITEHGHHVTAIVTYKNMTKFSAKMEEDQRKLLTDFDKEDIIEMIKREIEIRINYGE